MKKLIFIMITLLPVSAFAHETHGAGLFENLRHVLSNPEHTWPLTIALLLVVIGLIKQRN